ncbi:hypothetical protein BD311DRAFT_756202 [Dichomitus squalens]|uniref:Uncharacterized protein n=1 Tax=Dichomitus squalens TaxID=114155 RepID=A0A4Q9MPQ7_9APHY|nr:hypothetical protein BD311DRAFT_756202 [Dichomitus squalens]
MFSLVHPCAVGRDTRVWYLPSCHHILGDRSLCTLETFLLFCYPLVLVAQRDGTACRPSVCLVTLFPAVLSPF